MAAMAMRGSSRSVDEVAQVLELRDLNSWGHAKATEQRRLSSGWVMRSLWKKEIPKRKAVLPQTHFRAKQDFSLGLCLAQ